MLLKPPLTTQNTSHFKCAFTFSDTHSYIDGGIAFQE